MTLLMKQDAMRLLGMPPRCVIYWCWRKAVQECLWCSHHGGALHNGWGHPI